MLLLEKLDELQLRINEFREMTKLVVETITIEEKQEDLLCLENSMNNWKNC